MTATAMAMAIVLFDVVLFSHILAVVLAFGIVFTYPLLDAHLRRTSAGDLVVLHRMQVVLTQRLITPAMVVVLVTGLYLALDRWDLAEPWIGATFAILIVLFGLVGAVITPTEKRCAELAARDRDTGRPSAEYEAQARKLAILGAVASLLIVVAIFLMTVKPGA